ncbi:MAG: DUF898 domain-containing protein [Gammaproteobacteria bacterium]|nr:DUF898 domain-containing protein [Gammaproteobacteria bacterium]
MALEHDNDNNPEQAPPKENIRLPAPSANNHPSFVFSGRASEYFSIWVVNVVLTVITLGMYGPWAKVRTNQYFYSNTNIDGSAFQYLADPKKILKGRLIATVLLVVYYSAGLLESTLSIVVTTSMLLLLPFLMVNAMAFQLRNSAYRNVRFDFQKNYVNAYKVFMLPLLLISLFSAFNILMMPESLKNQTQGTQSDSDTGAAHYSEKSHLEQPSYDETNSTIYYNENENEFSNLALNDDTLNSLDENTAMEEDIKMADDLKLYLAMQGAFMLIMMLLWPYWDYLLCRFRSSHSQYGQQEFNFLAKIRTFYNFYLKGIIIFVVALGVMGGGAALLGNQFKGTMPEGLSGEAFKQVILAIIVLFFAASYLLFFAYFQAKRTNAVYSNLTLDGHQVQSNMKVTHLFFLYLTNSLAMALSFGLLMPWAKIRTARYRASVTSLIIKGNLNNIAAAQRKNQTALGEEIGNLFDMDLGV